ncbi:MAG: glycosyltransferase family 4 protein [Cyanobacteria bacterium J06634_6]
MLNDVKKVHIWMPNLFGFKGGIQVYSAYLLKALQKVLPYAQFDIFLLHDQQSMKPDCGYSNARFYFTGGIAQKIRNPLYAARVMYHAMLAQPDLIISTHLNFTPVAKAIKQVTNIPYWTVAHGVEAWDISRPHLQKSLLIADRILPVSDYTRDRLLNEQSLEPERLHTLPNTVDTQQFQIGPKPVRLLKKYCFSANQPVILTVNRLCAAESFKSYDQVIAALPAILQQIPNTQYLIVGKGDDRDRLEQLIQDRQLQSNVTLAGFVPDEELCDYYNLCDVFAMPSKLEGFGIVYLEAIACGKPALGGNQDGAVDALQSGKLGALVTPDDSELIAQTLIQIIRQEYSLPLMYQPQALRKAVIDLYGFESFQQRLSVLLHDFFARRA